MDGKTRLNKYLAECGIASRRESDRLIEEGRVTINGRKAVLGDMVDGSEKITVNGRRIGAPERKLVVAFYKPVGVAVTESDPHTNETVMDYIDLPERLTYAGRLDKDSEGLLLMTNDGDLIHSMMQGSFAHEKEYIVYLNKEPEAEVIEKLSGGVYLVDLEKKTRPCRIEKIRRQVVRMVLTEGLNRQIRRMWKQEGIEVKALKRTRVVNITLGDLEPGEYSILSDKQVADLRKALEKDSLAPRPKKTPRKFAHNVMKTGEGRLKTVPAGPRKTSLRGANPRLKELAEKSGKVKQGPGKKR